MPTSSQYQPCHAVAVRMVQLPYTLPWVHACPSAVHQHSLIAGHSQITTSKKGITIAIMVVNTYPLFLLGLPLWLGELPDLSQLLDLSIPPLQALKWPLSMTRPTGVIVHHHLHLLWNKASNLIITTKHSSDQGKPGGSKGHRQNQLHSPNNSRNPLHRGHNSPVSLHPLITALAAQKASPTDQRRGIRGPSRPSSRKM